MDRMARLSRATKCKYCGAEICFIKTANGKSMPVDPEPITFLPEDEYEKFVLMDGTVKRGVAVEGADSGIRPLEIGYRSHFSTCPYAEEARQHKNKSERTRKNEQAHIDD